jgi:glyoxylase-like metal-dependent hydrolase (beta-lactamase superfamily II)
MPRKQEQEEARDEVTEVGPGVLRMELPIRMPGLGHVNCYALLDDEGAAVVDPGMPTPSSYKTLKERLKRAGIPLKHVHTVVVTHSHPDHFGGASRIARETGARVVAHDAFRLGSPVPHVDVSADDLADHAHGHVHDHPHAHLHGPTEGIEEHPVHPNADPNTEEGRLARPGETLPRKHWEGGTPWGGERPRPPFAMRMAWGARRLFRLPSVFPTITDPVKAGDVVRLAGRDWFVVHTPGHTEDHVCLHDPEEEIFLAGDHVLPTITPHISGLSTYQDPLNAFFDSLDRVAHLPHVGQVLPAHGHPFDDLAKRCEDIKLHHDQRLGRLKEIAVEIGPNTVEAFMQRLFRERSWGGMAESETYAHLEHLRISGHAGVHRADDGKLIYEL